MYLSRVELDLTRRSTMEALAAPQKLHGAVESAFAGERRRRLWRLDRLGNQHTNDASTKLLYFPNYSIL